MSGLGANAPIPPVFGPLSSSKMRLWSCAVPMNTARRPSHKTKNDTSGPTRHSSITSRAPAAPNRPSVIASRTAVSAAARSGGNHDPFSRRQPVGFQHQRIAELSGSHTGERLGGRVAGAKTGGRHVMPLHELFRKGLAGLEARGRLRGSDEQPTLRRRTHRPRRRSAGARDRPPSGRSARGRPAPAALRAGRCPPRPCGPGRRFRGCLARPRARRRPVRPPDERPGRARARPHRQPKPSSTELITEKNRVRVRRSLHVGSISLTAKRFAPRIRAYS